MGDPASKPTLTELSNDASNVIVTEERASKRLKMDNSAPSAEGVQHPKTVLGEDLHNAPAMKENIPLKENGDGLKRETRIGMAPIKKEYDQSNLTNNFVLTLF